MQKQFERVSMNQNDDGTYTISITPMRKKEKSKDGEPAIAYQEDKTYTAASLEDAIHKIRGFGGEAEDPEDGDVDGFMNPMRGMAKEDEEE
jgi:hypothetical protein